MTHIEIITVSHPSGEIYIFLKNVIQENNRKTRIFIIFYRVKELPKGINISIGFEQNSQRLLKYEGKS